MKRPVLGAPTQPLQLCSGAPDSQVQVGIPPHATGVHPSGCSSAGMAVLVYFVPCQCTFRKSQCMTRVTTMC